MEINAKIECLVYESGRNMELSNEDKVTKLLSTNEILKTDSSVRHKTRLLFKANPKYDLTGFLKTEKNAPSRFGQKYIFVK